MAKKKGNKSGKNPKKPDDSYRESNEYHDGLDLEGADAYEAVQDEEILSKMSRIQGKFKPKDVSGGIDELYAMSGDSDSDDDDDDQFYAGDSDLEVMSFICKSKKIFKKVCLFISFRFVNQKKRL